MDADQADMNIEIKLIIDLLTLKIFDDFVHGIPHNLMIPS
jgi:hypothetical protein